MNDARLDAMRRDYANAEFSDPPMEPFTLFRNWFSEACDAGLPEPNAMSLATSAEGDVTCRTVLLKAFDARGFVFFTHYDSLKARQIAVSPRVALLFTWLPMARQIRITGEATKISASQSLAYFLSRPFGSKVGAWISQQSKVISSRQLLMEKFEEACRRFADGEVPMPEAWGGYRVEPSRIEFWQGSSNRLHDRLLYTRVGGQSAGVAWQIERLAP